MDVLVVGAGPAGTTAAAVLARSGYSVLLVEKLAFPRFHIGESLIPGVLPILEGVGARERIVAEGFVRKYAAEFVTPDEGYRQRYVFADSLTPTHPLAYQVERSKFDSLLLDHARQQGATLMEAAQVTSFTERTDHVVVELEGNDGEDAVVRARFLLDASGQHSLVARRRGLRRLDQDLRNVAVYAHFAGAARASGDPEGDITVVLDPEGWWWVIPLRDDVTSLGFVAPKAAFGRRPDLAWMEQRLAGVPVLAERFRSARALGSASVAADYSYSSSTFVGERWALVGDAAAFLDPVFSTGVYLGVSSAERAARAVAQALAEPSRMKELFTGYDSWLSDKLSVYGKLVRGFYDPSFIEVFMHPTDAMQLRQAVTSALAGFAELPEVSRRLRAFLNAVRINRHQELSPRLPGRREAAARLAAARK